MTKQSKLEERIAEIEGWSDKQLVWALCASAGWEYCARKEMRIKLADNLYKDLELMKYEALGRMGKHVPRSLLAKKVKGAKG